MSLTPCACVPCLAYDWMELVSKSHFSPHLFFLRLWTRQFILAVLFLIAVAYGRAEAVNAQSTATPTPTAAPQKASVPTVILTRSMNIRGGPGTSYAIVGSGTVGQRFAISGVNAAGDRWQIVYNGGEGWIYAPFVRVENTAGVSVVTSPVAVATPIPAPRALSTPVAVAPGSLAPAPAPIGTVVVYESSVTLPTYPIEKYQSPARNETYNWPYLRFDRERFRREKPTPEPRTYKLLVLENTFLKITVLPQLGGRIWQVIHKPTGANMFYQNAVVKPSPWGPAEQLGWTGVGGLEWNLPVVEHGYDLGTEWGYIPLQHSPDLASITVFTPRDGRYLNASIAISLRSGAASFEVEPAVSNLSNKTLTFAYWQTALLAPGPANKPSGATQFLLPGSQMTVHSTEDQRLPAPGQAFNWPIHNSVDYAWLQNWTQFVGFFERPAAHGPFVGIYDHTANAGAVHIFPADVVRGSKVFGLGWKASLGSDNFTDDSSAYIELHNGLSPTFDDSYRLPPAGAVRWREVWYPIHAIGGLTYADEVAALNVRPQNGNLTVGIYPTRPLDGALVALVNGQEIGRQTLEISPQTPFNGTLIASTDLPARGPIQIRIQDSAGRAFFQYTYSGPLR